ncbi:hypothetical protein BSY239_8 [Hydrogenophaga sp. RAC07]|uniref:hypothetical protein n=1 Tax=Hydrogenophaga sp. RAC07 TaxID=1842537 RepID=UPI00083E3808|nr:hypothetical protein [Hydrogenophaga sp. RAC07]AOF85700.1 hypothetical protein BSY239_8 [Hydrogenophaga sp. RAC07]
MKEKTDLDARRDTGKLNPGATRKRPAASPLAPDSGTVPAQVLGELKRRVLDIEAGYREIAQKMGQLYMYADQQELAFLTRLLDRPMRNASDNERAMVSILDELSANDARRLTGSN